MKTKTFRLRTLGVVSLDGDVGGSTAAGFAAQRKAIALLVLLVRAGARGLTRDKVLSYLWPESETNHARNALSGVLFRIRRALCAEAVVGTADLKINFEVVESDVTEFETAVAAGDLERASALYAGPFLDGFYVREAPEFERWATEERARLAAAYQNVLEQPAAQATARDDGAAAVVWWRKRAEAEPMNSRVAGAYVEALIAAGERELALAFVSTYATLVRAELGTEPDVGLMRRAERLRQMSSVEMDEPKIARIVPAIIDRAENDEAARKILQHPSMPGTSVVSAARRPPSSLRRIGAFVALTGCAALAAAALNRRLIPSELDADRVLVASFDNETGDSTLNDFGRIAANIITEQLARAAFVSVVDPATALASSKETRAGLASNPSALRALAQDNHARVVVTGSYFRDADTLVVQAHVTDARRNEVMAATEPVRGAFANRTALLDAVRDRVIGALALRLDSRLVRIVPPGNTPTYEAYQAFIRGLDVLTTGESPKAAPYFERAYALDSSFVQPLIWIGYTQTSRTAWAVTMLEARRAQLSEIDRYALDYERAVVSGTWEELLAASRSAARLAPGSHWTHNMAEALYNLGRTREAIDLWSTIDRQHGWLRSFPRLWVDYFDALHDAGQDRDALDLIREARVALPSNQNLQFREAIALARTHKWQAFDDRIHEIERTADPEGQLGAITADLQEHGETARAKSVSDLVLELYDRHLPSDSTLWRGRAIALYRAGRFAEAARAIDSLGLQQPNSLALVRLRALIDARTGNRARAQLVADSLAQDAGTTPLVAAAGIAAALGNREQAVTLLRRIRDRSNFFWPSYWHTSTFALDFASLKSYPPFERLRVVR